jgi:hypothetical protein
MVISGERWNSWTFREELGVVQRFFEALSYGLRQRGDSRTFPAWVTVSLKSKDQWLPIEIQRQTTFTTN